MHLEVFRCACFQWYRFQSCLMIHFWENTFWAKTSLSFVFRGPNSAHPEVFRCAAIQWYKFQSCMMICFWENTFWAKTSLSFVLSGPNSEHPEVLRHANHNGTSFKAVWWSISEKTHFGLKHHFPLYLEGHTQYTLRFSGMPMQWYKFQSCMMICFWENTFWAKTSLSFVFRGPNSAHPEVFRHAQCNGTSFKAVWWSISEKTHFGLKHHFPLYLEGQTLHTLRFSGMLNAMVQVSKLYDDLFLRKHILG